MKDQQKSFYSHWNGSVIHFDRSETRSPTSTSPPTPLAMHPQAPTSQRSSQDSVSSPSRQSGAHASQQNPIGFAADSFASPTHNRLGSQADQPVSLIQSRVGGRSPVHHINSNIQPPIGSHVLHRKSNSMDSSQAPSPLPLNGFGVSKAVGGNASNRAGRPSPKPQHAHHVFAASSNNGPIASLLGLDQDTSNSRHDSSVRSLRASKSLQYSSTRNGSRASANGFDPSHLLPQAIHGLVNGSDAGISMMPQGSSNGRQTNHAKQFGHVGSNEFSQHADAFQRQLRVTNTGDLNM